MGRGRLYSAIKSAGYSRRTSPIAVVQFKAASMPGAGSGDDGVGDMRIETRPAPPLGADQRFLSPSLRQEPVDADVTSISTFRQKSRTLADPSDMIRAIAQTDAKPETDTEAELVNEALHQIATVSTGVANVMLENDAFRGWINVDLAQAFAEAIDHHITTKLAASTPTARGCG